MTLLLTASTWRSVWGCRSPKGVALRVLRVGTHGDWTLTTRQPSHQNVAVQARLVGLALALMLAAVVCAVAATFDFDAYKPELLSRITASFIDEGATNTYDMASPKYRVPATYTASERPIRPTVREFIHRWTDAARRNQDRTGLYEHEILVREGTVDYWLPIQEPLLQSLRTEVRAGTEVELFVVFLGASRHDLVMLVNEYQVPQNPGPGAG